MSDKNVNGREIDRLLAEIDSAVDIEAMGKRARLTDAKAKLTEARAELVGLRRMLVQHRKPEAVISQDGMKLGEAIRDTIKQVERLEAYVAEIDALPDDPDDAKDDATKGADEHDDDNDEEEVPQGEVPQHA